MLHFATLEDPFALYQLLSYPRPTPPRRQRSTAPRSPCARGALPSPGAPRVPAHARRSEDNETGGAIERRVLVAADELAEAPQGGIQALRPPRALRKAHHQLLDVLDALSEGLCRIAAPHVRRL